MNIERELREALNKCHQDYALQMYEIAELKKENRKLRDYHSDIKASAIRHMLDEFKSEILDYEDWIIEYFADYADNLEGEQSHQEMTDYANDLKKEKSDG